MAKCNGRINKTNAHIVSPIRRNPTTKTAIVRNPVDAPREELGVLVILAGMTANLPELYINYLFHLQLFVILLTRGCVWCVFGCCCGGCCACSAADFRRCAEFKISNRSVNSIILQDLVTLDVYRHRTRCRVPHRGIEF